MNTQFDFVLLKKYFLKIVDSGGEAELELVEHFQIYTFNDEETVRRDPSNLHSISLEEHFLEELDSNRLPHQLRCCNHTLSLVATTDFMKVLKNNNTAYKVHQTAIAKCTILWNSWQRPKYAEVVRSNIECKLMRPCPTNWNSLFDSIQQILKYKNQINDILVDIGLNNLFKNIDFEYLEEYCMVMKPIATALGSLQSDNNNYYGQLFPTVFSLKKRLDNLILQKNFRFLTLVAPELLNCFVQRFNSFFELSPVVNNALIAAAVHPFFKLRWITTPADYQNIKLKINQLCIDAIDIIQGNGIESESNFSSKENFYVFSDYSTATNKKKNVVEVELNKFWEDKNFNINVLENYPNIKKLFIKFNTNLCSSAPVERLFSFAGFKHSPNRGSLSDKNFEMIVFLKGNEKFFST